MDARRDLKTSYLKMGILRLLYKSTMLDLESPKQLIELEVTPRETTIFFVLLAIGMVTIQNSETIGRSFLLYLTFLMN